MRYVQPFVTSLSPYYDVIESTRIIRQMTYAKALEEFYASTISKAERDDDERTLSLQYFDFSKINVMITGRIASSNFLASLASLASLVGLVN